MSRVPRVQAPPETDTMIIWPDAGLIPRALTAHLTIHAGDG